MNSTLLLGLFLSGVAVSGLIITAYIIFVITLTKQMSTVNGMLLVQLAFVEFSLSVCFLVCSVPHMASRTETSSSGSCYLCGFSLAFLRPIAIWTVCGLNCDRYYAISAPLHYGSLVNPRKVLTAISLVWISSFLSSCLSSLFHVAPYNYDSNVFSCIPNFTYDAVSAGYAIVQIFIVFWIPLILVLVCNFKVFLIARYHKHRIASAIFEVTLSAQVTITHQKNPFRPLLWANKFKGRSAFGTVLQLVGSFFVLYVPYYSMVYWDAVNSYMTWNKVALQPELHSHVMALASTLLTCSPAINGLLYGIKSKILRKSFQNYWRKKMTKNEVNQEIQARTPSTCGSRRPSLTPAGFFGRQSFRRPSEISVETQKSNILGTSCTKLQQCLNDVTALRPSSSPGFVGISSPSSRNDSFSQLKRTRSFRSNSYNSSMNSFRLQNDHQLKDSRLLYEEEAATTGPPLQNSSDECSPLHRPNSPNLFIQRFRKLEATKYNKLKRKRIRRLSNRCSPRILITRAFSEENDSTASHHHHHSSLPPKQSSSVTTLLIDSTWKTVSNDDGIFNNYNHENDEDSNYSSSDELVSKLRVDRNNVDNVNNISSSNSDNNNNNNNDHDDDDDNNNNNRNRINNNNGNSSNCDSYSADCKCNNTMIVKPRNGNVSYSMKSWPHSSKKKRIKFRVGSIVSEENFSTKSDEKEFDRIV